MPDRKYEADVGPGFGSVSKLLQRASSVPLHEFLDAFPMAAQGARELPEMAGHLALIDRIVEGWKERAARL